MSHITSGVCGIIGLAAIATGSLGAMRPLPVPPAGPGKLDEQGLQRLAEASCRCERAAGPDGKSKCWAAFDRQLPPPAGGATDMFTACLPVDQQIRCGGTDDMKTRPDGTIEMSQGPCVTMRYTYNKVLLCSQAEASTVEKSWRIELSKLGQPASGRISTPSTDRLADDIAAGKPLPALDGAPGCTG